MENIKVYIPELHDAIRQIRIEAEPISKQYHDAISAIVEMEYSADKQIVEAKQYIPLNVFEKYKGFEVLSVEFYCADGTTETECGELCEIDENGHLYVSDYQNGITGWDDELGEYCHWYHHSKNPLNYVGVKEICFSGGDS